MSDKDSNLEICLMAVESGALPPLLSFVRLNEVAQRYLMLAAVLRGQEQSKKKRAGNLRHREGKT